MIRTRSSPRSFGQPSRAEKAPAEGATRRKTRARTPSTRRAAPQRVVSIERAALGALAALLLVTACRLPAAESQARAGDFAAVRQTLAKPDERAANVHRLALEVLRYEIKSAKDIEDRSFIAS